MPGAWAGLAPGPQTLARGLPPLSVHFCLRSVLQGVLHASVFTCVCTRTRVPL